MHLKSLQIINYRKFAAENNTIEFVASSNDFFGTNSHNSVAASTTLIVGRNNAGKTTVTSALHKLVNEASAVLGKDFNFNYLILLLKEHSQGNTDNVPFLEFNIVAGVNKTRNDLLSNLSPFISVADVDPGADEIDVSIRVKYEITESTQFKDDLKQLIDRYSQDNKLLFRKFLELIDKTQFSKNYFGLDDTKIKGSFKLGDLITLKTISAQKALSDNGLSTTFNKIIKYRYENATGPDFTTVENSLDDINQAITDKISTGHQKTVNEVLHQIESDRAFSVTLSADLNFEKLLNSLIKYEYCEGELSIPESQFGLGYSNLMHIIGEIISYVEKFPEEHCQSKINLISIEEPETHMHPQMQELFIKYIDDAVVLLLKSADKKINSQLVITTHSSHILNSKIHSSNSFNNINYISTNEGRSNVVKLNDTAVSGNEAFDADKHEGTKEEYDKKKLEELKFLKKHIKYKVSELFFSDAVIFVEGVTEETILPYYIEQDDELKKFYISIFNINGAHGQVYYPLVRLLNVPTLLITDLDIKRSDDEKNNHTQISNLNGKETTNSTIKLFNNGSKDISQIDSYYEDNNLYGVFQREPTESFFATSFEEAFILTNYQNAITNDILKSLKPRIYKQISESGPNGNCEQIKAHSYKLQKKLSDSKSDFANELLFKLIASDDPDSCPGLPSYIQEGLDWLRPKIPKSVRGRA